MSRPHNPYIAPSASAPRRKLAHGRLKYFYLAGLLAPLALSVLAPLARGGGEFLLGVVALIPVIALPVAYFTWVHRTWSLVPEGERGGTTPGQAVAYHFIPVYSVFWMFAWNNRVATKLRDTLSKYPTRLRAPTILAWAGPALATLFIIMMIVLVPAASRGSRGAIAPPSMLTMLLPLLGLSPFLWFAWMARVDNCHQEISFQRAEKKKLRKATSAARARDAA